MLSRWVGSLLAMGIGAASLGCSGDDDDASAGRRETLERAQQTWQEKAPESYVFAQSYSCFCPDSLPARIVVVNGQVVSAVLSDGSPAPERRALTIDGYFDVVSKWIDRNPDKLEMAYDKNWGFPAQIDADFDTRSIDDEQSLSISCFVPGTDEQSACPLQQR